jgi:hypothetical protein
MNSQELRALQEAYMEVVMNEGWKPLPTERMKERQKRYQNRSSSPYQPGTSPSQQVDKRIAARNKSKKIGDVLSKSTTTRNPKKLKKQTAMGDFLPGGRVHSKNAKQKEVNEDIYDIILSHLLDEGYAETQEAAEVIMVNMSEDWRESIMEGNVSKKTTKKDAKTREKWYGEKSIERGTDRFSQLQKKAIESGNTKLF